eukprot:CAMPEP_0174263226 /NCGR_PEP_ID=MMETSP0439-20130205/17727_1 /TAXON_ID=0 /ORGANISM="Stereomyxa ramosa, Strain Chinc5" /LENGTH=782 /DNA_ID=CAMNT_0015348453 /DNA_START=79 /DNA_END=2430 /DNA_ORIENTATION=+
MATDMEPEMGGMSLLDLLKAEEVRSGHPLQTYQPALQPRPPRPMSRSNSKGKLNRKKNHSAPDLSLQLGDRAQPSSGPPSPYSFRPAPPSASRSLASSSSAPSLPPPLSPDFRPPVPPKSLKMKLSRELRVSDENLTKKERRAKVLTEILESERSYVQDLNTLITQFQDPISRLISENDKLKIFSNLPSLAEMNKALLLELEASARTDEDWLVADIFLINADYLKIYTTYSANQSQALETISALKKKNVAFAAFIKTMKDSKKMDLSSYLIKPIQRICKYPLLLQQLIKVTVEDHKDHAGLIAAHEKLQSVAQHVEDYNEKLDNLFKMSQIQKYILPGKKEIEIIGPARTFLFEHDFMYISRKKSSFISAGLIHLFLFNDLVVLSKPKEEQNETYYQIKAALKLIEVSFCKFTNPDNKGKAEYLVEIKCLIPSHKPRRYFGGAKSQIDDFFSALPTTSHTHQTFSLAEVKQRHKRTNAQGSRIRARTFNSFDRVKANQITAERDGGQGFKPSPNLFNKKNVIMKKSKGKSATVSNPQIPSPKKHSNTISNTLHTSHGPSISRKKSGSFRKYPSDNESDIYNSDKIVKIENNNNSDGGGLAPFPSPKTRFDQRSLSNEGQADNEELTPRSHRFRYRAKLESENQVETSPVASPRFNIPLPTRPPAVPERTDFSRGSSQSRSCGNLEMYSPRSPLSSPSSADSLLTPSRPTRPALRRYNSEKSLSDKDIIPRNSPRQVGVPPRPSKVAQLKEQLRECEEEKEMWKKKYYQLFDTYQHLLMSQAQ